MGSLKDEVRDVGEDHQPPEKTDDGKRPAALDGGVTPEGAQTSQESTTRGDEEEDEARPIAHTDTSHTEEESECLTTKDQGLSGEDADEPGSTQFKNCRRTDGTAPKAQPGDDEGGVLQRGVPESLKNGAGVGGAQERSPGQETEEVPERVSAAEALDSSNPLSPDPRSPAPVGQQHMRTQVSLEVVQCRSAATSPMTPPEGGHAFFFPLSFGGAVSDTKDAELPAGQQVEFCSVATSPMTPRTPSTTAFPELIGREGAPQGKPESGRQESFPVTRSAAEAESEKSAALDCATSKAPIRGSGSAGDTAAAVTQSQGTVGDGKQQGQQQRMGSLDQDITILVTHHGNSDEEEEEETTGPEMVQIHEDEVGKSHERKSTGAAVTDQDPRPPQSKAPSTASITTHVPPNGSEGGANKEACEESGEASASKAVPESPAPFGCHNIRTQVSLEVVQCQSVATSPMTPPEGDQAFYFPSSTGKGVATGAAERPQVEFRSVATAPMTPRTPIATTFPEVTKETKVEKKIEEEVEEEEEKGAEQEVEEKQPDAAMEEKEDEAINSTEERSDEPVQEVNWDEKGMTWEVYGAVVEVAVLGSAIQKHLEKQVKKQKKQPSLPPPPPLNPSATPLASSEASQGSGSGSGKGRAGRRGERDGKVSRRRRNPFRLLMENVHQPNCCSRAHSNE